MTALDVLNDHIGCENDEGYGCSCCVGRPQARAALADLEALVKAAQRNVGLHSRRCTCSLCRALARLLGTEQDTA